MKPVFKSILCICAATFLTVYPSFRTYALPDRIPNISEVSHLTRAITSEESALLEAHSSLSDYLTYAALNNPGLRADFLKWKAALEKIPEVRSLPDPRFTYAYFIERVETRVGPQRQKFSLTQAFPWFGTLKLKQHGAIQHAQAAEKQFEAARLKLFYQVKKTFFDHYFIQRSIAVTRDNISLLTQLEKVAQTGYSAGTIRHSDIIRVQVELGKLQERLDSLMDRSAAVTARFNAVLNRPLSSTLFFPDRIESKKVDIDPDELLRELKSTSPELQLLEYRAHGEKWNIELARKKYYPNLTLGLEVIDTGEAVNPGLDDSGKDPVIGIVSINIPIWRNTYRSSQNQVRHRYNALQLEHRDMENRLAADIRQEWFNYLDTGRKIDLFHHTLIPKTRQALQVNLRSYSTCMVSFSDVIDSVRTLLELELGCERALTDQSGSVARLEMLTGRELADW